MPCLYRVPLLAFLAALSISLPGAAQERADDPAIEAKDDKLSVFELPRLRFQENIAKSLIRARRYADAERVLARIVGQHAHLAAVRYQLAMLQAAIGKKDAAFDNLAAAIQSGFRDAQRIANEGNFAKIRKDPRFEALVREAAKPVTAEGARQAVKVAPAKVANGIAVVDEGNTGWNNRFNVLTSFFEFAGDKPSTITVRGGNGPVDQLLNGLYVTRKGAGNHMDLYDNRDRGHSKLVVGVYPQLTFVEYSETAKRFGTDYGSNDSLLFNQITFGNSSTAFTGGPYTRSHANIAMTRPGGPEFLQLQYRTNQLYVYPEHRDHDPDRGDVFPANTPYMLVSQGSSGSDQPFLDAVASILAGFKPDTKAFLRERRLVMPTVQMVFRRGLKFVTDEASYLDGRAHPSVFDAEQLDVVKMVKLANELNAGDVPPVVELNVVEENKARHGIDYFSGGPNEILFDTSSAIARVFRSVEHDRRMVVSAGNTKDPNGRDLAFRWVVLRGDAKRIQIKPANESKSVVELTIPWHERHAVPGQENLTTDRVDIGVFADNGVHLSAPAFVSVVFPGDEKREYNTAGQIVKIDYQAPEFASRVVDPILFPSRDWADSFEYDGSGRLIGWQRSRGGKSERYTRDGAKVVEADSRGRPVKAQAVGYGLARGENGRAKVVERPVDKFLKYSYIDANDRYGVGIPE